MIPRDHLRDFAADHPHVRFEHAPDTNHYTIVLGNSPGPARVAAAIQMAVRDARRSAA